VRERKRAEIGEKRRGERREEEERNYREKYSDTSEKEESDNDDSRRGLVYNQRDQFSFWAPNRDSSTDFKCEAEKIKRQKGNGDKLIPKGRERSEEEQKEREKRSTDDDDDTIRYDTIRYDTIRYETRQEEDATEVFDVGFIRN